MLGIMERDLRSSGEAGEAEESDVAGGCIRRDGVMRPTGPGRAAGRLESHFGVPHPNPEVSAGESIEAHAWLRAE